MTEKQYEKKWKKMQKKAERCERRIKNKCIKDFSGVFEKYIVGYDGEMLVSSRFHRDANYDGSEFCSSTILLEYLSKKYPFLEFYYFDEYRLVWRKKV